MLKINGHSSVLGLFIFITLFSTIRSQEFDVTIWGLSVGSAELQQISDNEIYFKLQSNEFIDYVFPIDLEYYSKFDKKNYAVIENKKITVLNKEEQAFDASLKSGNILVYNEKDSVSLESTTHSLLSYLVRIINSPIDSIDTKWYNLVNEGILYNTRLLWNDTTTISINNEDILCDHYRLDLKILDDDNKIFDKTDYFNELFFDINSVRQIWVEKWQKQQKIIKIQIKKHQINLSLTMNN